MATRPARTPFDRVPLGEHNVQLSTPIALQSATIWTLLQRVPLAALAFDPASYPLVKIGRARAWLRAETIHPAIQRAPVRAYRPRS